MIEHCFDEKEQDDGSLEFLIWEIGPLTDSLNNMMLSQYAQLKVTRNSWGSARMADQRRGLKFAVVIRQMQDTALIFG